MRKMLSLLLVLLSGCAVGYEPANARSQGYFDMIRDDGTVVVTYRGNEHTTLNNAQRFAFCRAAEVMHSLHRERFAVVEQKVGDEDPATVTTCGWWWVFWGRCVTEHAGVSTVTLVVRPIDSAKDTQGFTYLSEETSSCRKAQAESSRQ